MAPPSTAGAPALTAAPPLVGGTLGVKAPPPGVAPAPQPQPVAPRPEQAPITETVMVWDDESESIEEKRASLSKYSGVEARAAADGEGEMKDPPAEGEEDGGDAR